MAAQENPDLQTVDLETGHSVDSKPVLEFDSPPLQAAEGQLPQAAANSLEVEGTELQGRPRTSSRGATLKEWGVHQYKVTKQVMSERFGKGLRTVDQELEDRICSLKETQRKYAQLIALTAQFHSNFLQVVETQKSLAEHFAFMSVRAPELHHEFHYNAESQKRVSRNGETLLAAVKFFSSNMQTVSSKTMEDTLQTVKMYETARITYDAYRSELEQLTMKANSSQKVAASMPTAIAEFEKHKQKFEQLRQDVDIKLKLLDENKVRH